MSEEKSKLTENALAVATSIAYTKKEIGKLQERIDSLSSQKEIVEIVGPQGEQGPRGLPGIAGEKGDRGERGDKGDRGEHGIQGIPGAPGEQGFKGDKGDKGERGDVGPQGPQGEKGDRGEQGVQGEKGDKGDRGDNGLRGEKGDKGDPGPQGEKGDQGLPGRDGKDGKDGAKGKDGKKGDKGDPGLQGLQGPQGEKGDKGDKGDPGQDADVKPIEDKFKKFADKLEKEFGEYRNRVNVSISRALASDAWKATGSGEVNLRWLDDVNRDNIQDGFVLSYDEATQKFTFISPSAASFNPLDVTQVFAEVKNAESFTITKGQAVYLYAATGNKASVKLAYNTGDPTSAKTLGLVYSSSITPGGTGYVITQGVVTGVNTQAYNEGDTLYLGVSPGSLTSTKPYAPNHLVYIGVVERANQGQGQIYVRPQNGYELHEIHDVNINHNVALANAHIIVYNSSLGIWENRPISYLGLSTSDNVARTIANSAYDQANVATTLAQAAYDYANTLVIPSLSGYATNATLEIVWSTANAAYDQANAGGGSANLVGYAVNTTVDIVWSTANSAYNQANSANSLAQAAYDAANNVVLYDQDLNTSNSVSFAELTVTGNTTVQNIIPSSNLAYDIGTQTQRFRDLYLSGNSIFLGEKVITSNLITGIEFISNSAYAQANSANSLAQAAYDAANTKSTFSGSYDDLTNKPDLSVYLTSANLSGYATESYVNTSISNLVNSAPAVLDTLSELANALGNNENFSVTVTNSIGAAQSTANTAWDKANNAFNQANTATALAQAAYDAANNVVLYDQDLNTSNSVSFAELNVTGNTNTQNVIPTISNLYNLGSPSYRYNNLYGSSLYLGNTVITSVSYTTLSNTAYFASSQANGAFDKANSAYTLAQNAYDAANTGGGGGGNGIIKTYNILNEFSAPLIGNQIFVPLSTTFIKKIQVTNGETAGVDIMLGLYRNSELLTFLTLPAGLITSTITGLNLEIRNNDYITVNVVAGAGKNLMMTMFDV